MEILSAALISTCLYALPFAPESSFKTLQGTNGKFSHQAPLEHAVDFSMPIGTPITATRDGVVKELRGDSDLSGKSLKFIDHANFIKILHSDGSLSFYAHLKKDGVLVDVGEQVKRGQVIGLSGCTGFCDGPHLHYEVYHPTQTTENTPRGRVTIPIKTKTKEGITEFFERQTFYTAVSVSDEEACK